MTYRSNYPLQEAITLLLVKPALKDSKTHVLSCHEPKKLLFEFACVQGKFSLSCKFFLLSQNSTTNQTTQFALNWNHYNTIFSTNLCLATLVLFVFRFLGFLFQVCFLCVSIWGSHKMQTQWCEKLFWRLQKTLNVFFYKRINEQCKLY